MLADVQTQPDERGIALGRAGVADLRLPTKFVDRDGSTQATVATASAWAAVPANQRGTHMSRLVTLLGELRQELQLATLPEWLAKLATQMQADPVGVKLVLPLFVERQAPISKQASWLDYQAEINAEYTGKQATLSVAVIVPVKMLCPCSKEISETGAHAQRAHLTLKVWPKDAMPLLADLVALAEEAASAQVDAVIKRSDEKFITESAYAKPRFAEDAVREAARSLVEANFSQWQVNIVNYESIHNHQVFAEASSPTP